MSTPADRPGGRAAVGHVGVLVPVRDEELLLPGCLRALAGSAEALLRARPGTAVTVVVVLDGCADGSREVARASIWPPGVRLDLLSTGARGVGAARAAGAALLLDRAREVGAAAEATWLAGTDADSAVPRPWLLAQLEAAERGADAWVGTVELSSAHPAGSPQARLAARWSSHQRHHEDHDHVHGANLGVRASAYLAAGGYPAVLTGEDVQLVDRLQAGGAVLVRTAAHPVVTSDRCAGRAPDGVAADLAELAGLIGTGDAAHVVGPGEAAEAS